MNHSRPAPPPTPTAAFHPLLPLGMALLALAVSLFFHAPRLWALAHPMPGSTYWDRGLQFMLQAQDPLHAHLNDPGLVWRLAPALGAKILGLRGDAVFIVPWLGLIVLLTQCAYLALRRTGDRRTATLLTLLLGTTGVTLTVTGWLGLNDAWYASALIAVGFQPALAVLVLALLVGPWIDERFILALPLALYVRARILGAHWRPKISLGVAGGSVATYALIRILNPLHLSTAAVDGYLHNLLQNFTQWLPWASLGWFMGLRAAWVLVVIAIGGECRRTNLREACWPAGLAIAPLLAITVLAADTGRAPTMLLPLVLLGAERLFSSYGAVATRRILTFLLIANLLLPAMHVTYKNGDIINMLPLELTRWLR